MSLCAHIAVCGVLGIGVFGAVASAGDEGPVLYGVDGNDLLRFDLDAGETNLVNSLGRLFGEIVDVTGLAADPASGMLFASADVSEEQVAGNAVLIIDPSVGAITNAALLSSDQDPSPNIESLAFDPRTGPLYGWNRPGFSIAARHGPVVEIDPATGEITETNDVIFEGEVPGCIPPALCCDNPDPEFDFEQLFLFGLAFDPGGGELRGIDIRFGCAGRLVDIAPASAEVVSAIWSTSSVYLSLARHPETGELFGAKGNSSGILSSIDPDTGEDEFVLFLDEYDAPQGLAFLPPPPADDTDNDGLLDEWETEGIPFEGAGGEERRYELPGADPLRKNMYVEIDLMSGVTLEGRAIGDVIEAFSNAPVDNPDGSQGISLTVIFNETDLPLQSPWMTNGCWPLDFDQYREDHYGTEDERNDPDADALLAAKAKAVRYCIGADRSGPESIGGCGQRPGDNTVLYLGTTRNISDRAALLMHELGHNLGLQHGGGDGINGKPNYPSIMNYTLTYKFRWNQSFWRLDYSREGEDVFSTLEENDLVEADGVGDSSSFYSGFFMPFGITVASPSGEDRSISLVQLNGSEIDFGDARGSFMPDDIIGFNVDQDLNWVPDPPLNISLPGQPSFPQDHEPHNDWANIELGLAAANDAAPAPAFPDDELTTNARDWMDTNFPSPGCNRADLAAPFGTLNDADVEAYITAFQAGDPVADLSGNGSVGFEDLNAFAVAFAAGCP